MAGDEQDRLRARARLALRAEQAFGLNQIPTPPAAPSDSAAPQVESSQDDARDQELHPAPQATPGANLFGIPEPAPQRGGAHLPIAPAGPFATPELSVEEKRARLLAMDNNEVRGCTRCRLHERRTHTVFGEGAPDAKIFFIGEGPGENEDLTGRPFVGKAGQLLDKQIAAMGLRREQVFIANIVKCLRYSTLVQLENGSWERIGRLVAQRYGGRVMSIDEGGQIVPKRVIGWHRSPLAGRRVYKVSYASSKLRGGNRAVTWMTHDHRVMTRRGWVAAENLLPSDEIATGQGLSRVAYEVAIGSLLGDGTISPKNAFLGMGHSRDQRDYVAWKAAALRELSPIVHDSVTTVKSVGREYLTTVCRTRATRALRVLRDRFYSDRRKFIPRDLVLTPRMLAIWFLDDGYTRLREGKKPLAEIAAHCFCDEDLDFLVDRLRVDIGLGAYRRPSGRGRLHFDVPQTKALSTLIAPFTPRGMRYKLHPDVRNEISFRPDLYEPGAPEVLFDRVIAEPVDFVAKEHSFFCIDVEDTHNFVTSGGVMHNCRPPGNREPAPDEVATCTPYLERQLEIVRPKVIVTLGRPAAQHMLQSKLSMSRLRGQWHEWRGIKLMPTFHPAYLLRSYTRENREMVWSDLQQVMREVGLKIPTRGGAE